MTGIMISLLGSSSGGVTRGTELYNGSFQSYDIKFNPPGGTATARAGLILNNAGIALRERIQGGVTSNLTLPGQWLTSGSASDYEVFATLLSGTLDGGVADLGVWRNLGTTRQWSCFASRPIPPNTPGTNSQTANIKIEIRKVGFSIETTATFTFTALAEVDI